MKLQINFNSNPKNAAFLTKIALIIFLILLLYFVLSPLYKGDSIQFKINMEFHKESK